ncbi:MAG: hypothetical protein KAJ65_04530, partial [Gammaproteobacteria bacterium]|nr:hypothetical protein [Gammaproteobacteria bacterium]
MKTNIKKLGASNKMKALSFFVLCAICAMAWTFVNVGKQVGLDQARLADVGEQLVLSQRVAKYALAATTGDSDAFSKMETSKNQFTGILDKQMAGFGKTETPESIALNDLGNRWSGFRYNIDEVLEGQFLIIAMAEATTLMSEVMP